MLESTLTGDSILGDFNTHVGNDSETWRGVIGRNGLPNLGLLNVITTNVNYDLVVFTLTICQKL